jgi:hypothetical protein
MIRLNWSGLPKYMIESFLQIGEIRGIRGVFVLTSPGVSRTSDYTHPG